MVDPTTPFDISNGQKIISAQLAIRTNDFDRTNYGRLVGRCELIAGDLIKGGNWKLHVIESCIRSLIIDLHSVLLYRKKWGSLPTVPLSKKNYAELGEDATILELVNELRNGFAHPIDGQCLPHCRFRINGIDSVSFYLIEGQEYGLDYPQAMSREQIGRDLSFGIGHLRISLWAQIEPLIGQLKILPDDIAKLPTTTLERELAIRITGL